MNPLTRRSVGAICIVVGVLTGGAIGYAISETRCRRKEQERTELFVAGLRSMDMRAALEHYGISEAERNQIYDEQMAIIAQAAQKRGHPLPPGWPPHRPFDSRHPRSR